MWDSGVRDSSLISLLLNLQDDKNSRLMKQVATQGDSNLFRAVATLNPPPGETTEFGGLVGDEVQKYTFGLGP